ncbi:MAG: histidine phosphatase family protein [Caldimonas sp.]
MHRRHFAGSLAAAALWPTIGPTRAASRDDTAQSLLRDGGAGLVVVMRHALAPGTFDPPGFLLGDCSTQRNLSDVGRAQARRIGAWYEGRGLKPTRVRSSRWCRCVDTAQLAFGTVQAWPELDSIIEERAGAARQTAALHAELARLATARAAGFEVWVTHQVNIGALVGHATAPGEAVLLRHDQASGAAAVLGALPLD